MDPLQPQLHYLTVYVKKNKTLWFLRHPKLLDAGALLVLVPAA